MGHISTLHIGTCIQTFLNGTYFNTPCWNLNKKHSLMEHSSTLLDGIYDYLTCTLLNRSFASNAICCKIALKWLKSQKVKIPLRHPKKWWPPILIKIGQKKAEIPNFHLKQLLWTFLIENSFIFGFEIWSHQGAFWLMHTPCPIYITMKTVYVCRRPITNFFFALSQ